MLPFIDPREFHLSNSEPHYSFSSDGQFENSFGSSVTAYDECCTLLKSDSFGVSDLNGLSSLRTSLASNGSNSSIDDAALYSMNSMNHMVKNEAGHKSHLYVTSYHPSIQDQNMMNYGYSQVNDICGPLEHQDDFCGLPGVIPDNSPGFSFHDTTSPLQMTSSPDNFVVPSQTFISESYRPTTPTNMTRTIVDSPLDECGESEETVSYFMSPRETWLQAANPSPSSGSHSTSGRTSSSQTLESSVTLHLIQSIGGFRISKCSKRLPRVIPKIDHVPPGIFRCNYPGCKSDHRFKRHEHLKRHQKIHEAQRPLHCPFCNKCFASDRRDNYRTHVVLHTQNKTRSRTKFFPEAIDVVNSWKKKNEADQTLGRPGERHPVSSRRGRAGGLFKSRP